MKEILILKVNEIIDEICPLLDSLFDDWVVKGIAREENQIRFSISCSGCAIQNFVIEDL